MGKLPELSKLLSKSSGTMRQRGNLRGRSKYYDFPDGVPDVNLSIGRFVPVYFEPDISSGQPVLTDEGRKAVEEELALAASSPLT